MNDEAAGKIEGKDKQKEPFDAPPEVGEDESTIRTVLDYNVALQEKIIKLLDQNIALGEQNEVLRAKIDEPRVNIPCERCEGLRRALTKVRREIIASGNGWRMDDGDEECKPVLAVMIAEIDDLLKGE